MPGIQGDPAAAVPFRTPRVMLGMQPTNVTMDRSSQAALIWGYLPKFLGEAGQLINAKSDVHSRTSKGHAPALLIERVIASQAN